MAAFLNTARWLTVQSEGKDLFPFNTENHGMVWQEPHLESKEDIGTPKSELAIPQKGVPSETHTAGMLAPPHIILHPVLQWMC